MTDGLIPANINQQLHHGLSLRRVWPGMARCVVCVCRDTCWPPPCSVSEDTSPPERDANRGCCLLLARAEEVKETMKCVIPFAGSRVAMLASKWVKVKVGVVWEATAFLLLP